MQPGTAPPPEETPRWLLMVLVATTLTTLGVDIWLLQHGLVKMEIANASQLELHAMARDGRIVLATNPAYYAEALHCWFFHPIALLTPRLEYIAAFLNVAHYAFAAHLFVGARARLGSVAATVATLLYVTAPVSPVLSKHVISTAFVPLFMPLFAFAMLDLARGGGERALGRAVLWWGGLMALNEGHAAWLLPLGLVAWRAGVWRVPAWGVLGALALDISAFFQLFLLGPPDMEGAFRMSYPTWTIAVSRLFFIENNIWQMVPAGLLLFPLAAVVAVLAWRGRDRLPAGLGPMLLLGPPLLWLDTEAIISWQTVMFLTFGHVASRSRPAAAAIAAYAVVFCANQTHTYTTYADIPNVNFFSMSSTEMRYRMLEVLVDRFDIRSGELETLRVEHTWMEGPYPALQPGLSYVVDRVEPPRPPGGDRCFLIDDVGRPLPEGAIDVHREEAYTLVFQAWTGTPCDPAFRIPLPPIAWLDLYDGSVHVGPPPPPRTR